MSNILKGIINEAHYPEDPDEWEAMFGARRKPMRQEPDMQEPNDPMDDHYRRQDAAQAKYKKEVDVNWINKEGVAPNGERYNSAFVVKSKTASQGDNEIYKFNDLHWGAKKIVDTVKKPPSEEGEPYLTIVYYVDNHKHGYWKPWKDQEPVSKGIQFEAELMSEGISQENLADVLYHRLEMRYPDIVTRYGHEVVGDAVMDVAGFHAGAEELGTSDINIMIRQVLKRLEQSENVAEGYSELDNLKARFEKTIAAVIARAEAEGRPLTDREKKFIAILKGESQGVAEEKGTLWRVYQSEATGRYHVVKGYNKDIKMYKNKMGAGDFNSKESAQAKADELNSGVSEANINELSTEKLQQYKKAAGADARAADKAGDFARGDKRFSGIIKATLKQFDKEGKPRKESAIMKGLVDENLGMPSPGTYEQEYGPFKRKGQERTMKIAFEGKKNVSR